MAQRSQDYTREKKMTTAPLPADAQTIMAAARAVHAAVFDQGLRPAIVKREHSEFANAFPAIFGFVSNTRDFDFSMLEFMLSARGSMTQSDADGAVFGRLKERYVDPLLEAAGLPTDAPVAGEQAVLDMLSRGEGPQLGVDGKDPITGTKRRRE